MPNIRMCIIGLFSTSLFGLPLPTIAKPVESLKSKKIAWFFNKPGVPVEAVLSDMKACAVISQLAQGNASDVAPETSRVLLSAAWIGALGNRRANLDIANCMSSRDYRRFEILEENQKSFAKRLEVMEHSELSSYLTSSNPPEGRLAEYEPNGLYYVQDNSLTASGSLQKLKPNQVLPSILKFGGPLVFSKKLPPKPLSAPTSLDAAKATLVARLNFNGKSERFDKPDLIFVKRDPKSGHFVLTDKEKPIVFRIANHEAQDLIEGFQIFQVEPGQYALWQVNMPKSSKGFYTCLSTITIDVKAGDKTYLGDWTFTPENKYGVTNAGQTEAGLALKTIDNGSTALSSPNYMNGADTPCTSLLGGGLQLYYFELP